MRKINADELKKLWFQFFGEKNFERIDSASVVPENDATVLFTTAGMHPLVPYLLGEKHPKGNRLMDVQKCIRTNDIDEVGDNRHCTFFEMLGNWTLGECDKATMIKNSFEFLTSEKYLGIDKNSLAVSVFAGDETAPKDEIAHDAWLNAGLRDDQIFYLPKDNNWWALGGGVGPCGPDTEMFIDTGKPKCCDSCSPACDCGKYIEIWNDVFMQYNVANAGEKAQKLDKPNIDTGMGVERTVCILNNVNSVYDIGALKQIIDYICEKSGKKYGVSDLDDKSFRIVADHLKAAVFILGAGVVPAPVGQGYVLRRLIRRAVNYARKLDFDPNNFGEIVDICVNNYQDDYCEIRDNYDIIKLELDKEVEKFDKTLIQGQKEFNKVCSFVEGNVFPGKTAFRLYDTFGFPVELTQEMAKEIGKTVDLEGYEKAFIEHQEKSRVGAQQLFKGGLSDTSDKTARLHTATHIMLAGLRKMFGNDVYQKGSNITPERLRFDFNLDHKMSQEEIIALEDFVNSVIARNIDVVCEEMPIEKAREQNALGTFSSKYGEIVKVYTIGDVDKQICGGPHAKNTGDLKHFSILKEESSSAGIRRIKAVIQD